MENNIENVLQAIDSSDKNNDKVLDKTEISDFLNKIKEDNSDSAKIAREKIKSLKSKVGENIDKLKNELKLSLFVSKFDSIMISNEAIKKEKFSNAGKNNGENFISFGAYQFTEKGDYLRNFLKKMGDLGDSKAKEFSLKFKELHNKNYNGLDFNGNDDELISYLKSVGGTEKGIKMQKEVFFEETVKKGIDEAKKLGVTNINSIANIIDLKHNGGLKQVEKDMKGKDWNDIGTLKNTRLQYFKNQPGWKKNNVKKSWKNRLDDNSTISTKFDFNKIDLSKVTNVSGPDFKQLAIIGTAYEKISQGETNVNQTYIDNAYKALKIERPTDVGGIGHLSILDVLGFGYGALNVFGALMEGISGNWGDAIQKLTIAYIGYKNIEREVGGNLSDFSKKIDNITERYSEKGEIKDGGKNLRRILEKIYNGGDNLKVPEKGEDKNILRVEFISNLFPNDKADNIKYKEQIGKTFKDVNYEKLLNFNGEINAKNVGSILDQKIFDGLNTNLQNKVLNLLNISKREKISCFDEFNGVYEYVEWNLSPNIFDKITHGLDVTE